MEQRLLCLGLCPGCAEQAQGSRRVPLTACLPFPGLWDPLPSQDLPIRLQSPPFTQGLTCVPLSRWTVSPALKPPLAAPVAGGRGIELGTCRSSVCLWASPWTWVSRPRIPSPAFHARCQAGSHCRGGPPPRVEPWQEHKERPRPTQTLPGWLELEGAGQGPTQRALCAPYSGLLLAGDTLTRRKVPFASFW